MPYQHLADAVLALHVGVVVFVVGGLLVVPVGNALAWRWVNGWPFRGAHAVAIAIVVVQAWLGRYCPLTVLEAWLREQAGEVARRDASFVQQGLERLLYVDAPLWLLACVYTAFAALVVLAWWRYPPRPASRENARSSPVP